MSSPGSAAVRREDVARWSAAVEEATRAGGLADAAAAARGLGDRLGGGRPVVAFAGVENAGKSTLINRLAGRTVLPVGVLPGTARAETSLHADLDAGWLPSGGAEVVELLSLDDAAAAESAAADAVVLVVSATAALSLDERRFADELTAGAVLVVVTKLDQIEPSERGDVLQRVERYARSTLAARALPGPGTGDGGDEELARLQVALERAIGSPGVAEGRPARLAAALRALALRVAGEAEPQPTVEARAERLRRDELALAVDERRRLIASRADDRLDATRHRLLHELGRSLAQAGDPRRWWLEDFERELRALTSAESQSLEDMLERQLEADIAWLQREVARAVVSRRAPTGAFGGAARPARGEPSLRDLTALRRVTRIASGAAVAVSGLMLAPAGAAAGLAAGLLAESAVRRMTSDQRNTLERSVTAVVEQLMADNRRVISERIAVSYGDLRDVAAGDAQPAATAVDAVRTRLRQIAAEIDAALDAGG